MNIVLDLIILAIAGLSVYFAVRRGFIKTILSGASFLIAVIVAALLLSPMKDAIRETEIPSRIQSSLNETLADFVAGDSNEYDPNDLKELPEFLQYACTILNIDQQELLDKWNDWRDSNTETLRNELVNYISEPAVEAATTIIAFLILFLGTIILLKILTLVLDKLFTLPVLKQANKILGGVAGVLLALVRIYLFCWVVNLILPHADTFGLHFLADFDTGTTFLFRWFAENNLFTWLFG